jgi:hypothetical protein
VYRCRRVDTRVVGAVSGRCSRWGIVFGSHYLVWEGGGLKWLLL